MLLLPLSALGGNAVHCIQFWSFPHSVITIPHYWGPGPAWKPPMYWRCSISWVMRSKLTEHSQEIEREAYIPSLYHTPAHLTMHITLSDKINSNVQKIRIYMPSRCRPGEHCFSFPGPPYFTFSNSVHILCTLVAGIHHIFSGVLLRPGSTGFQDKFQHFIYTWLH